MTMMTYEGYPAKAPPAYDMLNPNPYPPTAPGHMYPASTPMPAPGHMYPAPNPTPAPEPAPTRQVNMNVAVGPEPSLITCPSCGASVMTAVERKTTTRTHLSALLICFLCFCCAWMPYCMSSCMNADHYCPRCRAYVGSYAK